MSNNNNNLTLYLIAVNSSGIVCGRSVSTDWPSRLGSVPGLPVAADLANRHFLIDEGSSSNTTYYGNQLGISLFDELIDGLDPQQSVSDYCEKEPFQI